MKFKSLGLQALKTKELTVLLCILLLVLPLAILPSITQATPRLQDKAFRFLTDVIGVDMSSYKISYANGNIPPDNTLSYTLEPAKEIVFSGRSGYVSFSFYNDSLTSCSFIPGTISQPYLHPNSDRFNQTLVIMQAYSSWINDSLGQQMIDLLKKAGSEKDLFVVSGNLSLRISIWQSLVQYRFSSYLNGVEYSGVAVGFENSNGGVFFDDYRVWQKIGDTTVNITQDQAIRIAQDALKGYTLKYSFGNGTILPISNLDVTGVYGTRLLSNVMGNSTLYPLYAVELNVTGLPTKSVGVGVSVRANDGAIQSIHQLYIPTNSPSPTSWFPSLRFSDSFVDFLRTSFVVVCFSAAIVVVVLIMVLRHKKTHIPSV
jgi:hypothetical protein